MFQHILLPTDGSQLSRETAERAVAFAKAANASVTALYARPVGKRGQLWRSGRAQPPL